jgi:hypothetical protein
VTITCRYDIWQSFFFFFFFIIYFSHTVIHDTPPIHATHKTLKKKKKKICHISKKSTRYIWQIFFFFLNQFVSLFHTSPAKLDDESNATHKKKHKKENLNIMLIYIYEAYEEMNDNDMAK